MKCTSLEFQFKSRRISRYLQWHLKAISKRTNQMAFLLHKFAKVPDEISHHVWHYIDKLAMKCHTAETILRIFFISRILPIKTISYDIFLTQIKPKNTYWFCEILLNLSLSSKIGTKHSIKMWRNYCPSPSMYILGSLHDSKQYARLTCYYVARIPHNVYSLWWL